MIIVLSPSKTLDFASKPRIKTYTQPALLAESETLIKTLRGYSEARLKKLMGISDKLAALNAQRYKNFHTPFTPDNAKQAILAFKGDVYEGIDVESYGKAHFEFAQKHVRILSGLYGLLKPLDLIQPYRLEMGIRLPTKRGKDLYGFWGDLITEVLNAEKSVPLINLASEEYFSAVKPDVFKGDILHIVFKEKHKGTLKIIGLFAKKARGMMASFVVKNRITDAAGLKDFTESGYRFAPKLSGEDSCVFVR